MAKSLGTLLDFQTAWKRAKDDLAHRVFIRHPFSLALIEHDLDGYLSNLEAKVKSGKYHPSAMTICDVPKGRGAIRPGAHLTLEDRIVYAACVGACLPYIHKGLSWSQGTTDFSYLLASKPETIAWLRNPFEGWKNFQKKTLDAIGENTPFVLFTDITGFYENIVLEILMSDLRQLGAPEAVVVQLSSMLNKWAEAPGRALPQGHAPSDILAKVYLNSIDEALQHLGFTHFRYVDDFRILCRSEIDAKTALMELTRMLRRRGLCLQTSKTEILSTDKAREKIEGITRILIQVRERFLGEIREFFDATGYLPFDEAERLLEASVEDETIDPNEAPIHVIREAFEQHFVNAGDTGFPIEGEPHFDKTLFHFLLNRLGKAKDESAIPYCVSLLSARPEETEAVLRYLERIGSVATQDAVMAEFLGSRDAIYPYQKYQIIEWRLRDDSASAEPLLSSVRLLAADGSQPAYLRSVCRAFIGRFGTASDLEQLQHSYADARGTLEQCEIICCLSRMERRRRNTFFARVEDDGDGHKRAVAIAKRDDGTRHTSED
jgi:hypothetical protein